MNIGTTELVLLSLVGLNSLALILLHVIGDIQTMRRRYQDATAKRSGKRDRYRPSLIALVYHKDASADIPRCLDSLRTNPYPITKTIVIDTTDTQAGQKVIKNYRKEHPELELSYRSLRHQATWKQQTGSIRKALNSKLVIVLSSDSALQPSSLMPAVKTFRNTEIVGVVGQTNLLPGNSLMRGLYAARQALINNFRRAYSGTGLFIRSAQQPAIMLRTIKLRRIINANDNLLPGDVADYAKPEHYSKTAGLVRSADLQLWVDDVNYRVRSVLFGATMLSLVAVAVFLISQLGAYNSLPLIVAIWLVLVVFAGLSQSAKKVYSASDKLSLALLAPFSVLTPFANLRLKLSKRHSL